MRGFVSAVVVGALAGAACGCLLTIDPPRACGDDFVDRSAGEQCEPGLLSTFNRACRDGSAAECDPDSCDLDLTGCGGPCNNGRVDEGEECDIPGQLIECAGVLPLDGGSQYARGQARCLDDCTLDRTNCNRCGNGIVDGNEFCDVFDVRRSEDRALFCAQECVEGVGADPVEARCMPRCREDCTEFDAPASPGELNCCLLGEQVIPAGSGLPCCGGQPLPFSEPPRCPPPIDS